MGLKLNKTESKLTTSTANNLRVNNGIASVFLAFLAEEQMTGSNYCILDPLCERAILFSIMFRMMKGKRRSQGPTAT